MNLNKLFLNYCKKNSLEINPNQLNLIEELNQFHNLNFNKSFIKFTFSSDCEFFILCFNILSP